jgi:4-hydroxy-3-polyprenylbenzoate decarboxylase
MKLVVAVGGASGSIYAKRLLDVLARDPEKAEVALCFSKSGLEVWKHEIGADPAYPFARVGTAGLRPDGPVAGGLEPSQGSNIKRWALDDFRAPFASGSAGWQAMVVVPCSTGGLARIAHGVSDDLIGRAADVMLKERRKLVLVVREAPLSLIHLENMLAVTRAGAVVLPAAPSFYSHPSTVEALIDTVVGRVLDQLGISHQLMPRWGEPPQGARA